MTGGWIGGENGSLTFLVPNLKDELAEVRFFGLGIFRLTAADPEPRPDQIAKIVIELYCERMEFVYLAG